MNSMLCSKSAVFHLVSALVMYVMTVTVRSGCGRVWYKNQGFLFAVLVDVVPMVVVLLVCEQFVRVLSVVLGHVQTQHWFWHTYIQHIHIYIYIYIERESCSYNSDYIINIQLLVVSSLLLFL